MAILQQAHFRYRKDLKVGKYSVSGIKARDLGHEHSKCGSGEGRLFGQCITVTVQPVCFFWSISITNRVMESENATWSFINSYHNSPAAPVVWAMGGEQKKKQGGWELKNCLASWKGGRPSKKIGVKRRKGSHFPLFAADQSFFSPIIESLGTFHIQLTPD